MSVLVHPGKLQHCQIDAGVTLDYFLYRPRQLSSNSEIIACVHGISRNARQQAELFRHLADETGLLLVAPHFPKNIYPKYQQLGLGSGQQRADLAFNNLLNHLARSLGSPHLGAHLFGYSGGAQFAHRFALGFPARIHSLSLCSAGWYTLLDNSLPYPYGLKLTQCCPGYRPCLDGFLRLPIQVMVGTHDTLRDPSLNRKRDIDRQQGAHRLERARNWFTSVESESLLRHGQFHGRFVLMPEQRHDFEKNMLEGQLDRHIASFIDHTRILLGRKQLSL